MLEVPSSHAALWSTVTEIVMPEVAAREVSAVRDLHTLLAGVPAAHPAMTCVTLSSSTLAG